MASWDWYAKASAYYARNTNVSKFLTLRIWGTYFCCPRIATYLGDVPLVFTDVYTLWQGVVHANECHTAGETSPSALQPLLSIIYHEGAKIAKRCSVQEDGRFFAHSHPEIGSFGSFGCATTPSCIWVCYTRRALFLSLGRFQPRDTRNSFLNIV